MGVKVVGARCGGFGEEERETRDERRERKEKRSRGDSESYSAT